MYYLPETARKRIKLSDSEIGQECSRYKKAKDADWPNLHRALENLTLYAPTDDLNIWPANLAQTFLSEDRPPNHYNLMQMFVEGTAGNFIINRIDPQFVDNSNDNIETIEALQALQRAFYADKDHFDYTASHINAIVNGCIYRGVESINIARTIEDPLGRIYFTSHNPTQVIFDQTNFTDDIARGSRECWKRFYLFPKDMLELFEDCTDDVKRKLQSIQDGRDQDFQQNYYGFPISEAWGAQYETIEHYHFKKEPKYIAFDSCNCIELPESPYEYGSEDDYFAKKFWAEKNGYDLQPEDITTIKVKQDVLYCTTFCPMLGIQFENRVDERQLKDNRGNGLLPFFSWSYITKGGNSFGVIDLGKGMQMDINKREAHKTKMFTKTPMGGKPWAHPEAFGSDSSKMEEFIRDYNDPSVPFIMAEDAPIGAPLFGIQQGSQINGAVFADENMKIDLLGRICRLPPAMQGMIGKSGESGVLFGRKVIEANVMQKVPAENLEQYQNYKYEAWLQLAIQHYGGRDETERSANFNRVFKSRDGGSIVLNEFMGTNEYGQPIVKNDISQLKNIDVIISKAKDNDYMKQAKREVDIAYLAAMPPTPSNAGFRAIAEADLAMNLDGITPEQRSTIEEMATININIARKELMLRNVSLDAQLQQAAQQQQQMQMAQAMGVPQQAPAAPNAPGPQVQGRGKVNPEVVQQLSTPNPGAQGVQERFKNLRPVQSVR